MVGKAKYPGLLAASGSGWVLAALVGGTGKQWQHRGRKPRRRALRSVRAVGSGASTQIWCICIQRWTALPSGRWWCQWMWRLCCRHKNNKQKAPGLQP
jgi:hypothetical protein